MSITDKKEKFKKAFQKINELDGISDYNFPETEDWMEFLQGFHSVMKQGSGLMWSDINEIINEEIK